MRPTNKKLTRLEVQNLTGLGKRQANRRIADGTATSGFLEARHRRVKAHADLLEQQAAKAKIEVERLKESIMTRAEAKEACGKIATLLAEEFQRFKKSAAPLLAGKDELQCRIALDSEMDALVDRIHSRLEGV